MQYPQVLPATLLAILLAASAASAKPPAERVKITLPVQVSAAGGERSNEQVGQDMLFGAQAASYRTVASLSERLLLQNGVVLFEAGTRLFEHTARGAAFTGKLYCKPRRITKRTVLPCLADADGDGAFESLWLGIPVFGSAGAMTPWLPNPDAEKVAATFDPVHYSVGQPSFEERLLIGFHISGSNPLLGQTHVYLVLSDGDGSQAVSVLGSHKTARLTNQPSQIPIADAVISAHKAGKKQYNVKVDVPLKEGERELVEEYQTQTVYVYVPG